MTTPAEVQRKLEEIEARDAAYSDLESLGQRGRDRSYLLALVREMRAEAVQADEYLAQLRGAEQDMRAERDAALAELSALRRDAGRYVVLRASVLKAPASAGMVLLTTEADIDAQCDQIAALSSPDAASGKAGAT